jgi:hypothetical protein
LTAVLARIVAWTAMLALALGFSAAPAFGDGDPASDVLSTQSLFLPQDAGAAPARQAELDALLQTAARSGYPIRVAVVASSSDLGSVTELWRQPQSYARFLGLELSLVYHGPLLVVMPDGFGLHGVGLPVSVQRSALEAIRLPGQGADLAAVALAAVERLAAASGHPIAPPRATTPSGSSSTDLAAWIAFGTGCALIALAWGASLRARPAHLRRPAAGHD